MYFASLNTGEHDFRLSLFPFKFLLVLRSQFMRKIFYSYISNFGVKFHRLQRLASRFKKYLIFVLMLAGKKQRKDIWWNEISLNAVDVGERRNKTTSQSRWNFIDLTIDIIPGTWNFPSPRYRDNINWPRKVEHGLLFIFFEHQLFFFPRIGERKRRFSRA